MNSNRQSKPRVLQRLDRLMADLNILLATVALCLVVLDATVFATLLLSDEILHRQGFGMISSVYAAPTAGLGAFSQSW